MQWFRQANIKGEKTDDSKNNKNDYRMHPDIFFTVAL